MFEKPLPKIRELDSFPIIWAVSFNGYKTYTQLILWFVHSGPSRSLISYYPFQKHTPQIQQRGVITRRRTTHFVWLGLDLLSASAGRCNQQVRRRIDLVLEI